MKKALSFAVALGLVASAAYVASAAELSLSGDARVRGVYKNNGTDFTDANADKEQKMDQRYRIKGDIKINDDVTINTRLVLGNQDFGDNTGNFSPVWDTADMKINTLGGTWTLGRQNISWGNAVLPFLIKDTPADWIMGAYNVGGMTLCPYLWKHNEDAGNVFGDGDTNSWGLLAIGKAGEVNYGVLLDYMVSDTAAAKASGNDTGYIIDPYFNTKVGPVTVLGEFEYQSGDLLKRNDSALYGGYVAGVMGVDQFTFIGLAAYAKNGMVADTHFAPSMLIGTTNDTAIIDFGASAASNDSGDSSYLLGAVAKMKVDDKLTVGALLGYLSAGKHCYNDETGSLVEIDLTADYELAQNATYKFGISYGSPDKLSAADDAVLVLGNAVEVKF